ncbi:hypothetical protein [Hymenobacter jeollabukensis]|uniref:Uncharacterized protein n=1 Tax=Hymenobacter jeollabukensis TaxID=2025313 RepID=A0A5R8WL91_9BACT|nr:hypothetical protein [Hymenobacter jeollabukensis]TLM89516.1 hypothetical protein FDY95_20820 [Hymenobacter jeollabukensis]
MQTRLRVTFNENYLDVPMVQQLFYAAMDAAADYSRGYSPARGTVTFTIYGGYTQVSLQRFGRLLHHHDSFAQLLVDGRLYAG